MIDDKTLIVSNYELNKLSCCALSSKIYISKDDKSRLYVKASSMLIKNINNLVQPQFEYNEYNSGHINCNALLENLKLNRELKIFAPLSISSLSEKLVVVTIWNGEHWYELICKKVELQNSHNCNSTTNMIVKVYLQNLLYDDINKLTITNLQLTKQLEAIPKENYWDSVTSFHTVVRFPINLLHSIEGIRKVSMPTPKFTEYGEHYWTPSDILFSNLQLKIDYDKRIIDGHYSEDKELCGGRRTSNGWEDKYLYRSAHFYRAFELKYILRDFISHLPECLATIKGKIQDCENNNIFNNDYHQMSITIAFEKPLKFSQINDVLKFDVSGSEYIYYL